jgi:hypothetical protein
MKSLQTQNKTPKKRSTPGAQDAMKSAFEQLSARYEKENQAFVARRRAEKYSQWLGAAKRFRGLSEALRLRIACRNIHADPHGYEVAFMRKGESFKRRFSGTSEESLSAAIRFRDEALKILGENFTDVPDRVLKALCLSLPVPGISRLPESSSYCVSAGPPRKGSGAKHFSFKYIPEEDAYAAAIECLETSLKKK